MRCIVANGWLTNKTPGQPPSKDDAELAKRPIKLHETHEPYQPVTDI